MTVAIWVVGTFCLATAAIHFITVGLVTWRGRFAGRRPHSPDTLPPVSILRPVCGIENAIERTLRSGFELDYPSYELVFCVASSADPVIALVEDLMAQYPQRPARLLIGDDRISINPKLNNLVKGWNGAAHDWIVMADSNVLMPSDYLTQMQARWSPGTGLVCSPPLGSEPDGAFAELECAFLNTFQARWQLAADAIGKGFAQGKTMFWRRENLDRKGGIEALAAEAAEDAAATKVIRSSDLDVRLVYRPFPQPLGHRSFAAVWKRQLRWARLRRVTFPFFFCAEFFVGGLFPILAAFFLAANDVIPMWCAIALAVAWYGAEALMAKALEWHCDWRSPFAWIGRDISLPILWLNAVGGNGFEWRGNQMNVKEESLMVVEAD